MNLLILSDLHIGANDKFDTFKWSADDFINSLKIVIREENIDKVILNGDIFELYKYTWGEIENVNQKLIDFFRESKFVFIKGNHYAVLPFGENSWSLKNSRGKEISIEHGHVVDFMSGITIGRKIQ